MTATKGILIGCGVALLIFIGVIAAVVGGIIYISQDVEGVRVTIDAPLDVRVGENFPMKVIVVNERDGKSLKLSDIDIADEFLEGFVIVSTDPAPKSSMHVPVDNSYSHTFDTNIPAGSSNVFTFVLRAEAQGIFRGDVDICEGSRFVTVLAQTSVKEALPPEQAP